MVGYFQQCAFGAMVGSKVRLKDFRKTVAMKKLTELTGDNFLQDFRNVREVGYWSVVG